MSLFDTGAGRRLSLRVAALGASLLLAACGGGGSVSLGYNSGSGVVHIPDAFALRATSAAMTGGPATLLAPSGTLLSAVTALLNTKTYATGTYNDTQVCVQPGGQLLLNVFDYGNDGRFAPGDVATYTFTNCTIAADGLVLTLNGQLQMTSQVAQVGVDTVSSFVFTPINLQAALGGISASYGGSVNYQYTFRNGNLNSVPLIDYVSNRIDLVFPFGRTDSLTAMQWAVYTDATGTVVTGLAPNHTLSLVDGNVSDGLTTSTSSVLAFDSTQGLFYSGQVRSVDGLDAVTGTVTSTDQARIDVDYNNDGTIDLSITTPVRTLINSWN
ncbi:MAG: hypothetical protein KGJ44_12490 [Betaproteobacteria bacterium]|nr:hypothetical protein [Betaproteobacteria bacterium]